MSGDLIDTSQMYLRTVFELEEADIEPKRARIVDRLHQAGPTVSQTVARMERDGLLRLTEERTIELTRLGFEQARDVMRHHRLAECFLINVLGIDYARAHDKACRWEHVMSEDVAERMAERLGNPTTSPYGAPIPTATARKVRRLADYGQGLRSAIVDGLAKAVFVLVDEHPQTDPDFMTRLDESQIRPGDIVTLGERGGDFALVSEDGQRTVIVPQEYASSVRVKAAHR
ncbi:metal-dependent transcriptional regulator [Propionibacterium australiense]|uniref:Metal-dependent transcriptional regulator n=1 Tax=Propionibacterium australiense TaxID=119981 RepID=A0A8B3FSP4_9ACTN|nr:metal-dependent transcriptional regulator [Propionibacterium australiense]RLP09939.1 metal-dependent transcriptional regulator [Propionibacterium australiense]